MIQLRRLQKRRRIDTRPAESLILNPPRPIHPHRIAKGTGKPNQSDRQKRPQPRIVLVHDHACLLHRYLPLVKLRANGARSWFNPLIFVWR
jgi:hypothetical protein